MPPDELSASFDPRAFPENAVLADPIIDPTTFVADLKSLALDRLHKM